MPDGAFAEACFDDTTGAPITAGEIEAAPADDEIEAAPAADEDDQPISFDDIQIAPHNQGGYGAVSPPGLSPAMDAELFGAATPPEQSQNAEGLEEALAEALGLEEPKGH